jgi:site-specific DNA recombinase
VRRRPQPRPQRVVGYVRVSTDQQADTGVSLAAQEDRIRKYAELYGLEIVDVVADAGASASTLRRPGLQRALTMLDDGRADGLLVAKLDRLTRRVVDLGQLLECYFEDRALLSVEENLDTRSAAGRMIINIMAVISQWERETIGERTAAALEHLQASGVVLGRPRFGYARASRTAHAEVPEEQETIRLIRRLRDEGQTVRGIAAALRAARVTTRTGKRWHPTSVQRVLSRLDRL